MSCRELLADFNFMVVRVEYQICTMLLLLQLVAAATINSALQLLIKGGFFFISDQYLDRYRYLSACILV